jgi:hypothetical protein
MSFLLRVLKVSAFVLASGWSAAQAELLPRQPVEVSSPDHLTDVEKSELAIAIERCWNVGSLPTEAMRMTVIVRVLLDPNGKPDPQSIALETFEGGSADGADLAVAVARRAIIRCGVKGYHLPQEKYDQWKDLSLVFNATTIRMR